MTTSFTRSLTVFSFSILLIAATAGAAESDKYGSAPPSLDYPTAFGSIDAAGLRKQATLDEKKNSAFREELTRLSPIDPFPDENIAPIDPIARKKYDAVKIGPAFKWNVRASNYDYYRYVTYYNIREHKERVANLPIVRAQCNEKGDLFSSQNLSVSVTRSLSASVSAEGLGLGVSFSGTHTFGTGHGASAPGGRVVDFIPYAILQDWTGLTFIELYDSETGKTAFLKDKVNDSPWWVYLISPAFAREGHDPTTPFAAKNAEITLTWEQKVIEVCGGAATSFGSR